MIKPHLIKTYETTGLYKAITPLKNMETTNISRAYESANELYALYGKVLNEGKSTAAIEMQYNYLVENNNFDNKVVTDDAGHYGVALCTGEVIAEPDYDEIKSMTSFGVPTKGVFIIARRGDKDYLINYLGEELMEADEIRPGIGAITPALFRKGTKWGIVSGSGKEILAPEYDRIESDIYGIYWLERDGKKGFMDADGCIVEPCFDDIDASLDYNTNVIVDGEQHFLGADYRPTDDPDEAINIYDFQIPD